MRTILPSEKTVRRVNPSPTRSTDRGRVPRWYSGNYLAQVLARRPAQAVALLFFIAVVTLLIYAFASGSETTIFGTTAFNAAVKNGVVVNGQGAIQLGQGTPGGIDPTTWAPTSGAYVFERPNFGTSTTDYQDFVSREQQIGGKYDGFMDYVTCNTGSSELQDAHDALANGSPFVVLSWCVGSNPTTIIPQIAAGQYDADIHNFASAVKSQLSGVANAHIIIRPFWEFNYQGSEWDASNYNSNYAEFGQAFTRFQSIFAQDGVAKVKWSLNAIRIGSSSSDSPQPYYNAIVSVGGHVDWMGIDAYPKNQWLSLPTMLTTSAGATFNWYAWASGTHVPLMVGETGILSCDHYSSCAQTRADWWANIASSLPSYPALKAVEIFDSQEKTTSPDWRIDASGPAADTASQSLSAYEQWVKSSFSNPLQLRP